MQKIPPKPPDDNLPDILTVKEAAQLLRVAASTIYRGVRQKRLPHFHVGRSLRFYKSALLALGRGHS